jgi:hypothetical protein
MPRGIGDHFEMLKNTGRTFWGLQRNIWVDLHAWAAVLMIAIIVIHIVMHWQWIVKMTTDKLKSYDTKRNAVQDKND